MDTKFKIAVYALSRNLLDANAPPDYQNNHQLLRINNLLRALSNLKNIGYRSDRAEKVIRLLELTKKCFQGDQKAIREVDTYKPRIFYEQINAVIKEIIYAIQNPPKSPIKAVFSDIDNTLIHKTIIGKFLHIAREDRIISKRAISILAQIGNLGIPIVLASGRRISSFHRVMRYIPHSFAVLEHGCIILEGSKINLQYASRFEKYIGNPLKPKTNGLLWEYEKSLITAGYVTDSKGRVASFRIDPRANRLSEADQHRLLLTQHPHNIRTVQNLGFIDFIPPMGGKDNAINYLLHSFRIGWDSVACVRDDFNDISMLTKARYTFTHSGAISEIKNIVYSKKGYVSPYSGHNGTIDLLTKLLGVIDGEQALF